MNPSNPTQNDIIMIESLFFDRMRELTRQANLRQPVRKSVKRSNYNNIYQLGRVEVQV